MAEVDNRECRCSNITIMQLFHQLKQRFPTVPDQIVNKVIEENHHNQEACESILRHEMHVMQCYPGALISGESRQGPVGPLVLHCPAAAEATDVSTHRLPLTPTATNTCPNHVIDSLPGSDSDLLAFAEHLASAETVPNSLSKNGGEEIESIYPVSGECTPPLSPSDDGVKSTNDVNSIIKSQSSDKSRSVPRSLGLEKRLELSKVPLGQLVREVLERHKGVSDESLIESGVISSNKYFGSNIHSASPDTAQGKSEAESSSVSKPVKESRTSCDISPKSETASTRLSHNTPLRTPDLLNRLTPPKVDTSNAKAARPSSLNVPLPVHSPHEYQVAVKYMVRESPMDCPRPFTSVNLTLRPPSSDAASVPIEITSRQGLTYTTATFDPKQGYQSQLQIRIGPVGGTISAYRKRVPMARSRTLSRSPCSAFCHSRPHVRELLKQQRERKDLMARELRLEKEKLRSMQIAVRNMRADLDCKPSPYVVSKLKGEIERLRMECSKLTTAVDLYSEQGNVPLGETGQDFYRNIYTGQRQQRNWSCRMCTFRNHPLLSCCEECEMPRMSLGTSSTLVHVSNPLLNNNNSTSCSVEETSTSVSRTIAPLQER